MKRLFLFLSVLSAIQCSSGSDVTVWSYNIRYSNEGDDLNGNGWAQRCPWICFLIDLEEPDVVGFQEVTWPQLLDMAGRLPGYVYVAEGRDGGENGEAVPVFYRKDRFTLLDHGTFWLSETPGKVSRGWDAALNRVCTWIKLRENAGGAEFWVYNLHNDHFGKRAPLESARLVLNVIRENSPALSENVFITGDFNQDQHSEMYGLYAEELADSYETAAQRYAPDGTFNKFGAMIQNPRRIDHIFSSSRVQIRHYGILTESWRDSEGAVRYPSDHYPVIVKATVK